MACSPDPPAAPPRMTFCGIGWSGPTFAAQACNLLHCNDLQDARCIDGAALNARDHRHWPAVPSATRCWQCPVRPLNHCPRAVQCWTKMGPGPISCPLTRPRGRIHSNHPDNLGSIDASCHAFAHPLTDHEMEGTRSTETGCISLICK